MNKTLQDVEAVIALGKPMAVIDLFAESYLIGLALTPILAAEEEYTALLSQEDQPDILDPETEEVVSSPDAERDTRIAELETEYPHLIDPGDESTTEERRPELTLDLAEWKRLKKQAIKEKFMAEFPVGVCQLSLGWPVDNRRGPYHNDLGNMELLRDEMTRQGAPDETPTDIRGADNQFHTITLAELRDTVIPEMVAQGRALYAKKWDLEDQIVAAQTAEELRVIAW